MKLAAIARSLGCVCPDNAAEIELSRIASPEDADESCITFIANPKYQSAVMHGVMQRTDTNAVSGTKQLSFAGIP